MELTTTRELLGSDPHGHGCTAWQGSGRCGAPATVVVTTNRAGGDPTFAAHGYRCPDHDPGPIEQQLPLYSFHNGTHGLTTAGLESMHTIGREQHDRVRACWINAGMGDWPATNISPASSTADLAVITAVLVQSGRVRRLRDDIRVIGQAGLDGHVIDGCVYRYRRACPVAHLSRLAGVLELVQRR